MRKPTGKIVQLNKPGSPWHGRFVIPCGPAAHVHGATIVELPEHQGLPGDKRHIMAATPEQMVEVSQEQQEQVANTLGLNLPSLPY